MSEEL